MVAGILLVVISIFVFSMASMILAGAQSDESNPLYWFASLFSGFIQTIEQRHQEATQFKENLGKEEATIESIPDIEEDISSSVEPQELVEDIPQNEIEDDKGIRNSFRQMEESEPEAETITEEPEETSEDFSLIQGHGGGSVTKSNPAQIYQDPIQISGQFDEESQSWQLSVSGTGLPPDASLMVIISTVDSESSTIASFTVQTNSNGNFNYSPGTLYNNLETDLYQVKILGAGEQIFNEVIYFDTFPEDVITWNLNPASLVAGESATLQVFGQVNLPGPYFQNTIMIFEGDTQTESIILIVMPDGELYGTKDLTFYESGTFTVKLFYDSLVREGTFEVSP